MPSRINRRLPRNLGTIQAEARGNFNAAADDIDAILHSIERIEAATTRHQETLYGHTWDDLRFPVQAINPAGAAAPPTVDTTDGTLLFSSGATNTIAVIVQMPHAWWKGSAVTPHIHWCKTTSAAGDATWRCEYSIADGNAVFPAFQVLATQSTVVAGTPDTNTANKHLVTSFGDLPLTQNNYSCIIKMLIHRIGGDPADTYGANAKLLEFDLHYRLESRGTPVAIYT